MNLGEDFETGIYSLLDRTPPKSSGDGSDDIELPARQHNHLLGQDAEPPSLRTRRSLANAGPKQTAQNRVCGERHPSEEPKHREKGPGNRTLHAFAKLLSRNRHGVAGYVTLGGSNARVNETPLQNRHGVAGYVILGWSEPARVSETPLEIPPWNGGLLSFLEPC